MNASFSDLVGEHWTEAIPPEPYCLVADIDAAFEQNILDLSQRKRIDRRQTIAPFFAMSF